MTTLILTLALLGQPGLPEVQLRAFTLGSLAPLDPEVRAHLKMTDEQTAAFRSVVVKEGRRLKDKLSRLRFDDGEAERAYIRGFWAENERLDATLNQDQRKKLEALVEP